VNRLLFAQEWAQPLFILGALAWAYALPYDGVWISFTVLGLAHFLTQISWLHDRSYFFRDKNPRKIFVGSAMAAALLVVLTLFIAPKDLRLASISFAYMFLFILPLFLRGSHAAGKAFAAAALMGACVYFFLPAFSMIGVFLPTVGHVGFFTLCFLLQGALRRGGKAGVVSALFWIGAVLTIFLFPPAAKALSNPWARPPREFWESLATATSSGFSSSLTAAYSFLTFCYTYHFLNWFTKTEILKWHLISPQRGLWILIIYAGGIVLCFQNYFLGYMLLLLPLSVLHVMLEFPLDVQVISGLPRGVVAWLRPQVEVPVKQEAK
jgi:hypothetical protein